MHEHVLQELAATIAARRADRSGKSYTHQLLESGTERCARKFGEEATETVIAAVSQSEQALAG